MASDWIPETVPAEAAESIRRARRIDVLTHQARRFRDFSILRLLGDVACQQKLPAASLVDWVKAFTPESSEGSVAQEKLLVALALSRSPQEDHFGSTDDYWAVIFRDVDGPKNKTGDSEWDANMLALKAQLEELRRLAAPLRQRFGG